jgi:hypothetical protein
MSSSNKFVLQIANVVAFLVTVVVNGMANGLALNGRTTGEISDLFPTLVTPPGYVFSIWGVIYLLLFVFAVFQVLPKQREETFLSRIGVLFVLSCVLNVVWLILWHYLQIALSVIVMFALLATLIAIYLRLDIGRATVSLKERICVHLPFSVYLGWITVASITNVAAAIVGAGLDGLGLGDVTWAILVIIVALIIDLAVIYTRRDMAYSLVLIWALAGITVKQMEKQSIFLTSVASIIIIILALILVSAFYKRSTKESSK